MALGGLSIAVGVGVLLTVPAALTDSPPEGSALINTAANVVGALGLILALICVPLLVASRGTEKSLRGALRRLGVRRFGDDTPVWLLSVILIFLVFSAGYAALFGSPEQPGLTDLGSGPLIVMLLVIAAPISEELCLRGMVFGGLRTRLPFIPAAVISGAIFGFLHFQTGPSAIPPITVMGFLFALLYERTGSIVPGIGLHALMNAAFLLQHWV